MREDPHSSKLIERLQAEADELLDVIRYLKSKNNATATVTATVPSVPAKAAPKKRKSSAWSSERRRKFRATLKAKSAAKKSAAAKA